MIILDRASKQTVTRFGQSRDVLHPTSLRIPSDRRVAIFSSLQHDTSVLIHLLAGLFLPSSGRIVRQSRVSFPIGHTGGFDLKLSIRENVAFVARIYGADVAAVTEFVQTISEIKDAYEKPFGRLSNSEVRRIGYIIAYSIPFGTYLHTNDFTRPGFRKELGDGVLELIDARAATSGMFTPSRNLEEACAICDTGLILHEGMLYLIDDIKRGSAALKEAKLAGRTGRLTLNGSTLRKMFGGDFDA